ncbi:MAG TPA: SRPBCC family protein, partial [Candidatus Solibacter sp.]|nr:SRPBCC family protein [Candidatus Solibacter sp.]
LMYFSDPNRGKRRRVIVRDKVNAGLRDVARELDKAGRDLRNRSHGLASAARSLVSRGETDDVVLVERARSAIGRAVSHPHAISVTAEPGGRILLTGPVLADEVSELLRCVQSIGGVKEVVNRLDVHREPGTMALLQGGRRRQTRSELAQECWTPALRVGAAAVAGIALAGSTRRGGFAGLIGTAASGALLARAVANRGMRDIFGIGGTRTVEFNKSIHILAPVEEVFEFWSRFENFPRFMSHLKEVRDLGGGRSHWVAEGPGGIGISWDAEITEFRKNERLAWRSVIGSGVNTEGVVKFFKGPDSGTTVSIHMSYCPPAGVFGHGVAWLFGSDPKSDMDDDLVRLKSLLEIGKTRAHGATVWREEFAQV